MPTRDVVMNKQGVAFRDIAPDIYADWIQTKHYGRFLGHYAVRVGKGLINSIVVDLLQNNKKLWKLITPSDEALVLTILINHYYKWTENTDEYRASKSHKDNTVSCLNSKSSTSDSTTIKHSVWTSKGFGWDADGVQFYNDALQYFSQARRAGGDELEAQATRAVLESIENNLSPPRRMAIRELEPVNENVVVNFLAIED